MWQKPPLVIEHGTIRNIRTAISHSQHTKHLAKDADGFDAECAFYRRFYDKALLEKVLRAFHKDYKLFDMQTPIWKDCI